MSQAVKRACDACHRRKVKCDGINPCRNCSAAQLSCTYNAIPQKKGPKGSRAKVISELRETQRQTSLSAKVQNRINGIACSPSNSGLTPTPGLLTADLVKQCMDFFFDNLYPQLPILDRRQLEHQMPFMEQNRDSYCLFASLCAYIMLQPGMTMPANDPFNLDMNPGATLVSSQLLLEEALRVRKGYEYQDSINLNVLATNFFIFGCYYGMELHDKAWYYLREATTMIHMAGINKEEHYMQLDASEATRRRRLFWLYLVIERAYAVQRHRPLTLQATLRPPAIGDDPTDPLAHQLEGFIMLVNLYRPFDDVFTATWNKARRHLSAQHITGLQKQLNGIVQSYLCQDANLTDLRTNQQWLKNTSWQLNNGTINGNGDDSISFQYPMDMTRELLMNMASQFPSQGMELLNSGLIEKLIETCFAMTDLLAIQPPSRDPFAVGPREHLNQILSIVAVTRNGDYRFLPLLLTKVTEVLPRLANPMLQNAPENSNLANIDIFDGFGNAGMAQPPPQMQMSMEPEYSQKYSVDDYEKKYSMDMAGGTPESANSNPSNGTPPVAPQAGDMNGNFVSSPGVMSPGMEYPHNMNGFACTPMSDMVMSPMGNSGPPNPMNGLQNQHLSQQGSQGHDPMCQPQITNMPSQGMHNQSMNTAAMPTSHPINGMYNMRQPQQRQGSFQLQGQPSMRTVGDFQGLQRAGSDTGSAMTGLTTIPNEMDFGQIR
ncbi:C6 zinc finger domain-containing protein [Dactylonectria macrodidyma]|uniref:C6 zinc finger domain-containing protein n=1 Tax=Dactylonectria macrodidyma TaxID=307937 RepID=A0A9P9F525_9HYPO|nr:C6 zinc finger domain-containing protein [Dactylonectria macrodidyma]